MHVRLPCNPASPGLAREFVLGALEREGKPALGEVASLLVSELVTNAYLHARSEVEVQIECHGDDVEVAVSDASPRPPRVIRSRGDGTATGRGLQLVDALAAEWGAETGSNGKTVWFHLAKAAPSAPDTAEAGS